MKIGNKENYGFAAPPQVVKPKSKYREGNYVEEEDQ